MFNLFGVGSSLHSSFYFYFFRLCVRGVFRRSSAPCCGGLLILAAAVRGSRRCVPQFALPSSRGAHDRSQHDHTKLKSKRLLSLNLLVQRDLTTA